MNTKIIEKTVVPAQAARRGSPVVLGPECLREGRGAERPGAERTERTQCGDRGVDCWATPLGDGAEWPRLGVLVGDEAR